MGCVHDYVMTELVYLILAYLPIIFTLTPSLQHQTCARHQHLGSGIIIRKAKNLDNCEFTINSLLTILVLKLYC